MLRKFCNDGKRAHPPTRSETVTGKSDIYGFFPRRCAPALVQLAVAQRPCRYLRAGRSPSGEEHRDDRTSESCCARSTEQSLRRSKCKLCDVRPVSDGSRTGCLERAPHMEIAVRTVAHLRLAAEVEVKLNGITERPPTIARLEARHRLSIAVRDVQVIGPERYRRALRLFHKSA